MIRLNDIDKTVIDESKVDAYYGYGEDKTCIYLGGTIYVDYNSKEARDKDIELLDQLFDVKSIEDKANAYPHELDALKFAMSGIKKECELVSEGEDDLVKKEEYLTWKDVESGKSLTTYIKALLNGKTVFVRWNDVDIRLYDEQDGLIIACIYDEDLFNALMLKKVE
jgi:hypothetical protein